MAFPELLRALSRVGRIVSRLRDTVLLLLHTPLPSLPERPCSTQIRHASACRFTVNPRALLLPIVVVTVIVPRCSSPLRASQAFGFGNVRPSRRGG